MLLDECARYGAKVQLRTEVLDVEYEHDTYRINTSQGQLSGHQLVVACGGLSMPKLGRHRWATKLQSNSVIRSYRCVRA